MNPITIACTIPLDSAVAARSPTYGDCLVTLTSLEPLSEAALALLADASSAGLGGRAGLLIKSRGTLCTLKIKEETEIAACEALEAVAEDNRNYAEEQRRIKDEERKAERERLAEVSSILEINPALANQADLDRATKIQRYNGSMERELVEWIEVVKCVLAAAAALQNDERILALDPASTEADAAKLTWIYEGTVRKLQCSKSITRVPDSPVEMLAKRAKWIQERDAARAARERAASAAREAAILAYVRACAPEWKRAADDGRDVSQVGAQHARDTVHAAMKAAVDGSSVWLSIEVWGVGEVLPIKVPTSKEYEARDALRRIVTETIANVAPELRALCGEPSYDIVRPKPNEDDQEEDEAEARWRMAWAEIPVAGVTVSVAMVARKAD